MNDLVSSEFDLIKWIRDKFPKEQPSIIRHIGDDCAVFDPGFTSNLAATTDVLLEDVHFRRRRTSAYFLGQKSVIVNLSDLAAMGCRPYGCLLSLGLPPSLKEEYFYSFMEGFLQESRRWELTLLGGNLTRSEKIYVNVTAWGFASPGYGLVLRSGAQAGDALIVIGDLGFSRLGLEMLEKEDPDSIHKVKDEGALANWASNAFEYRCVKAHLLPPVLIQVGNWLAENNLASAMIDVSDGLTSDLLHIARESKLEAQIEVENLPIPQQGFGEVQALQAALSGGEDYALLFTASPEQLEKLTSTYPADFPVFHVIGKLESGQAAVYLNSQGKKEKYRPERFDHFI